MWLMMFVWLCLRAGGEHKFLCDHFIDGRVLMPATSYVVTAWEALAADLDKPMAEVPVEFKDVAIHQPVVAMADQEVTLAVQLGPGGKFYVSTPSCWLALCTPCASDVNIYNPALTTGLRFSRPALPTSTHNPALTCGCNAVTSMEPVWLLVQVFGAR